MVPHTLRSSRATYSGVLGSQEGSLTASLWLMTPEVPHLGEPSSRALGTSGFVVAAAKHGWFEHTHPLFERSTGEPFTHTRRKDRCAAIPMVTLLLGGTSFLKTQ